MFNTSWNKVLIEIENFRKFLAPPFPPLNIEHALEWPYHNDGWKRGLLVGTWQQSGAYLIFDDDQELQYVGLASATFNKRIKNSFFQHRGARLKNANGEALILPPTDRLQ